jgi:hypothetical protein
MQHGARSHMQASGLDGKGGTWRTYTLDIDSCS